MRIILFDLDQKVFFVANAPAKGAKISRPFPKNEPTLQGIFAPVFVEGDAFDLPVTGEIPEALNGTYYRNGCQPAVRATRPSSLVRG